MLVLRIEAPDAFDQHLINCAHLLLLLLLLSLYSIRDIDTEKEGAQKTLNPNQERKKEKKGGRGRERLKP